jgi:hypothetical protein
MNPTLFIVTVRRGAYIEGKGSISHAIRLGLAGPTHAVEWFSYADHIVRVWGGEGRVSLGGGS